MHLLTGLTSTWAAPESSGNNCVGTAIGCHHMHRDKSLFRDSGNLLIHQRLRSLICGTARCFPRS
jgi:hypothetical protein